VTVTDERLEYLIDLHDGEPHMGKIPVAECTACAVTGDTVEALRELQSARAQLAALQRDHAASAARVVELEANAGKLPKEPPLGLLVSMALRQDHGLGVPGYYDNMPFAAVSVSHARRLQCALDSMRQVYEEVSGHGFWSPENECEYVAMHKAALAQPDAARAAGECTHEWVSARNEYVQSGEMCRKCLLLRAEGTP
jgi:hypothetical protein